VVVRDTNNLSPSGYRSIVSQIMANFAAYLAAAPTGGGDNKPDRLQSYASAAGAVVTRVPPMGGDPVVSGSTAIIMSERDFLNGNKSQVTVPLPPDPLLMDTDYSYLNDYLRVLVSELARVGAIPTNSFNAAAPNIVEVHKFLLGMMLMTRCR
jgi:hypothetical protein